MIKNFPKILLNFIPSHVVVICWKFQPFWTKIVGVNRFAWHMLKFYQRKQWFRLIEITIKHHFWPLTSLSPKPYSWACRKFAWPSYSLLNCQDAYMHTLNFLLSMYTYSWLSLSLTPSISNLSLSRTAILDRYPWSPLEYIPNYHHYVLWLPYCH